MSKQQIMHPGNLSSAKKKLLEKRIALRMKGGANISTVPRRDRSKRKEARLSSSQERLWLINQINSDMNTYNLPVVLNIEGELDTAALERSLSLLIARHEMLRTVFVEQDGEPRQKVLEHFELNLAVKDMREFSSGQRDSVLEKEIRGEITDIFDLKTGPLFKAKLYRLQQDQHILVLLMHHIITDGWSMGVMLRDIAQFYSDVIAKRGETLPELPIQYADYAEWQHEQQQSEKLKAQIEYWRNRLSGIEHGLGLPTDFNRPRVRSYRGASESLELAAELVPVARSFCQRENVTLFMFLYAVFVVLLHKYSGEVDLLVGTPVAGRSQPDVENLIGFFVNTLVLRTKISPDITFKKILEQVKETALQAYANQEVPFEKVVEVVQPQRDAGDNTLFQVMFVLQNAPIGTLRLPGLALSPLPIHTDTAKFDLTLSIVEGDQGLTCSCEYATDLFYPETIRRVLQHYQSLVRSILGAPDASLNELSLLNQFEYRQMINEWNATGLDYPSHACLHNLVSLQAQRTPNANAILTGVQSLTYAELDKRANQLAHYLHDKGIGLEARVGVCVEPSADTVVVMLAILKAGAIYVPLDPNYPLDRLHYMTRDAGIELILTERKWRDRFAENGGSLVFVETLDGTLRDNPETAPVVDVGPEHIAYIIYTSGSTGQPKGVMVPHRGVANLSAAQASLFGIRSTDRILQFASLSFDASIWEMTMALVHGAALVIAEVRRGAEFAEWLHQKAITVATLPPSLLSTLPLDPLPALRVLVVAGEACPPNVVKYWAKDRQFFNAYGPTESTVCATAALCCPDESQPSIGRPIANTQVYLLDRSLNPVPIGAAGEIYIGGVSLARGYRNRPDLTAERFVPDPFTGSPGQRLYRTGDLARYRADGQIEFLGRGDHQVKVRGFRIELGEVEAALCDQAGVREALVLLRQVGGDKSLAAYVVAEHVNALDAGHLRDGLRQRLPDYMLPSSITVIEAFPLTPNGKVDRSALPEPKREANTVVYVAPRNAMEESLCALWCELLGLESIGVEDNFFELGGHSLLATQAIAQLRARHGYEIPLRILFENSTISALARYLEQNQAKADLPVIEQASRRQPLPLSFAQQRLWFLDRLEPGNNYYNIPMAIQLRGNLNSALILESLHIIIQRHEVLRTTFGLINDTPVQIIAAELRVDLPQVDLSDKQENERSRLLSELIERDIRQPFDLVSGPLLRTTLIKLTPDTHVMVINAHHIISDAWSMGVFVKELSASYESLINGNTPDLPVLPIQYADFAAWQRSWMQDEKLQDLITYWKCQLDDTPENLKLPYDRPRPAVPTYKGARHAVRLPGNLYEEVKRISLQQRATSYMTLLTAYYLLLYRYSGQNDIVVGSPIANRVRPELEGLIGFFVNTLALRVRVSANTTFSELLDNVREITIDAFSHQDLPFEKLIEEIAPERGHGQTPLVQVMFVLQNTPRAVLTLKDLEIQALDIADHTSKFDMIFALWEESGTLQGYIEYNTDLFTEETISRIALHYDRLLCDALMRPNVSISELAMVSEKERENLLVLHQNQGGEPERMRSRKSRRSNTRIKARENG